MRGFGRITILFAITISLNCCYFNKNIGVFTTLKPYGKIELFSDSTYIADYKMIGYSNGKWKRNGDTIILNSKYNSCCIPILKIDTSFNDTSKNCVIILKNNGVISNVVGLVLESNTEIDSLLVFGSRTIKKSKNYIFFTIVQPLKTSPLPESKKTNISFKDSLVIEYDYVPDIQNYHFYSSDNFILDIKNRNLLQLPKTR